MTEASFSLVDPKSLVVLFGAKDQHVRQIRDAFAVRIFHQRGEVHVVGEDKQVGQATGVLEHLQQVMLRHGNVSPDDVAKAIHTVTGGDPSAEFPSIEVMQAGKCILPKSAGQAGYIKAIQTHDIVFCAGPAGTGKTYLAVAMAVSALRQQQMRKIVLVRPAVEAGESLGYLPGDLQAKINPYLRPLLDALREMMDFDQIRRYTDQDTIEVIPLAYMRGRTLNEAFIILDEAQNTTVSQMKMFLTRMGRGSKIVVSGDTTQIDLPQSTQSGLVDAMRRLNGIRGLAHVELSNSDIVRHPLVREIVAAYEAEPRRRG